MTKHFTMIAMLVILAGFNVVSSEEGLNPMIYKFNEFTKTHFKYYFNNIALYSYRLGAFMINDEKITEHNSQIGVTWTMGHNKFSDLYPEEFKYYMNGYKQPSNWTANTNVSSIYQYNLDDNNLLPDAVDWRAEGLVTPVKNQGNCGSCWAFSSTGAMEGAFAKKTGNLVSLSEQNLVDCVDDCYGCDGGWMTKAMEYVVEHGGIDTELSYPYQGVDQSCEFNQSNVGANFSQVVSIESCDCNGLFNAVATQGPISVAINANNIMNYQSGIYSDNNCDPQALDHGVLVVGYGVTSDGKLYYIIKNSWGTDWGQGGYMYWDRSIENMCGICEDAAYPVAA